MVKAGTLEPEKARARSGKREMLALLASDDADLKSQLSAGISESDLSVDDDKEENTVHTEESLGELSTKELRELVAELGVEPEANKRSSFEAAILESQESEESEEDFEDEEGEEEEEAADDFEDEEGEEEEEETPEALTEDDDDYWTVENLQELTVAQLRKHAVEYDVDIGKVKGKKKIAAAISAGVFE
jgi:hypothetical protein